jgi:hypothetical protein
MFKMNEFRIFAHGEKFDVDAFLHSTTLKADYIWRRGDQRKYACVESKHETSGVEFLLGDGWSAPFPEQEDIAIAYLKQHRDELKALAQFPGVETFTLGLQYICKLDGGILGFYLGPSARLMWHCLDIGIEPGYYVSFDRSKLDGEMEAIYKQMRETFEKAQSKRRIRKKP